MPGDTDAPSTTTPATRSRLSRWLGRFFALGLSTALAAGVAEVGVRVLFPAGFELPVLLLPDGREAPFAEALHYLVHGTERVRSGIAGPSGRLPPNMRVRQRYDRPQWDYFDEDGALLLESNSLGFRDFEFSAEKPDREFRVIAIGDSFTYGLGVKLEDCWVQRVEHWLEGGVAKTGGRTAEVVNAGWSGLQPLQYRDWFLEDGVQMGADVVLVGLCLNDLSDAVPMLAYEAAKPEPWCGGVSHLLNHLQREVEQRALMKELPDYGEVVKRDPEPWRMRSEALLAIRDAALAQGAKFGLIVLPMMSSLGDDYPYLGLHTIVKGFCEDNSIPFTDLLPRFRGLHERDLWVHPTDQHPNDVGHALIAAGVQEFLAAQGWDR